MADDGHAQRRPGGPPAPPSCTGAVAASHGTHPRGTRTRSPSLSVSRLTGGQDHAVAAMLDQRLHARVFAHDHGDTTGPAPRRGRVRRSRPRRPHVHTGARGAKPPGSGIAGAHADARVRPRPGAFDETPHSRACPSRRRGSAAGPRRAAGGRAVDQERDSLVHGEASDVHDVETSPTRAACRGGGA